MGNDSKICLSIETTVRHLGVGVFAFSRQGAPRSLATYYEEMPSHQSDHLIPILDRTMRKAKIKKQQLDLIAVDIGPGSFTGVRVGLAVARMMAQGLELPVVGVSGLEAMAWEIAKESPKALVVTRIPAVAGEVYFAAYRNMKPVKKPAWTSEQTLASFLAKNPLAMETMLPAPPSVLAEMAIARFRRKPKSPEFHYENVLPLYLQPTWAERSHRRKKL